MAANGFGRWVALILASFIVHILLTLNSTETALWNAQSQSGQLLARQLADAAAPAMSARDAVSLSVLSSQYEYQPGIASVRLYNAQKERVAETLDHREGGRLFSNTIQLQQQALGHVELRLTEASLGDIFRHSLTNIGLSALIHAFLFFMGWRLTQRTATQPARANPRPIAEDIPILSDPLPATDTTAAASPAVTLLHLAFDDSKNILGHVNVEMADELLTLFDQFADRVAQLYDGSVDSPFSPEGVLIQFHHHNPSDREFNALAAAALFLRLVEDSAELRRQHGRLCIGVKAGVLHAETDDESLPMITAALARTAPLGRVVCNKPLSSLSPNCHFGPMYPLALGGDENILSVMLLESFAVQYSQLIQNQSQQILRVEEQSEDFS